MNVKKIKLSFVFLCVLVLLSACGRKNISVKVNGIAMRPTFDDGNTVAVSTQFSPLERGDIVAINFDRFDSKDNISSEIIIKRIIALEGDEIDIVSDGVFVNGVSLNEPYINEPTTDLGNIAYPLVVPSGYVFVMGDNRKFSMDSRFDRLGCIAIDNILGKVVL